MQRFFSHLLLGLLVSISLLGGICSAADKNGVSPNTISLPSGPGSIEGLGGSFQPLLCTGTATYSVDIDLPDGVNGHAPSLSLSYNSGFGYGVAGIGWSFGAGSVSRQTEKGIPRYVDEANGADDDHDTEVDEQDELDRFIGLEWEELVRLVDGTYRARIEGTFIRYRKINDHWEAHLKNGTKLEFGLTPGGRVTDGSGKKIFRWLIEKSTDTNGNVIEYLYAGFPESTNQKYLKEIRYGPGAGPWEAFYFVSIVYEDRLDWRKDYRSGFMIKTTKRLSRINIGIQGIHPEQCAVGDWNDDGIQDSLIRLYTLVYEENSLNWSFLSQVKQYGADGASYLPPISFSYSMFDPEPVASAGESVLASTNEPSDVMDSQMVELVDLNRDGLPDLLKTEPFGGGHTCYINRGVNEGENGRSIWWESGQEVGALSSSAYSVSLSDNLVHLADMDGDGLSDLVETIVAAYEEVYYYPNEGAVSWGRKKRMSIQDAPPPAPFGNNEVKTTDCDFDKRMDVVESSEWGYYIWFNLGGGKYSRRVRTAGAEYYGRGILFSEPGIHLADMNGDRMPDVVQVMGTKVVYCGNMGHGEFDTSISISIPDEVLTEGPDSQVNRARLKDINGDGVADLVIERARGSRLWYWLNYGTDKFSTKYVVTHMPVTFSVDMVTRWADLNGNGTDDLIYADSSIEERLRTIDIGELVGGTAHPNLLTTIDNGLGVITRIYYRSSTEYYIEAQRQGNPWESKIPFPVTVVWRVETTPSLDLDTVPGIDVYVKEYIYRDGYYDDLEKAFRGFAEAVEIEYGDETAPTKITHQYFFTGGPDGEDNNRDGEVDEISEHGYREDEPLKGQIWAIEIKSENEILYSRKEDDWEIKTLLTTPDGIEVRFAYGLETRNFIHEGTDTPETLRTTFIYDEYGQVIEEKNYGALSISGDEAFTYTTYINDNEKWILGAVSTQYTTDASGKKEAETHSYYDGQPYIGLSSGQIEKGNLMRQEGWVAGDKYINLIRNAYDTYGNVIGILDGNGNLREVEYDSDFHTFPVEEIIYINETEKLTITAEYNLGLETMSHGIDFNGHTTYYIHNCFGELVKIVESGDSYPYPTQSYAYKMADPHRGLIYVYDEEGNFTPISDPNSKGSSLSSITTKTREHFGKQDTFDTIQYVDGLGRKLGIIEEAEEGFVINGAVILNEKGDKRYSFLPYRVDSSNYKPPPLDIPHSETHYDAIGRELIQFNPPEHFNPSDKDDNITYSSIQYIPLEKIVTDENNNSHRYINDGLERLIEVHEYNKGTTYITRYEYDTLGNLTKITDTQNNVKTMRYDGLKRKIEDLDPDRGKTINEFDYVGNLIRTTDNKGQVIEYTYDGANRMLTEDYLDEAGITPDITYHYDYASSAYPETHNLKGELSWIEDLSGAKFFSYDSRGNAEWEIKRIVHGSFSEDYKTSMTYDAMGRVTSMTYPDGMEISYTYNKRCLLESIPGVMDNIDFAPSSQVSSIFYANGLETNYHYDPRDRLIHLETRNPFKANSLLQDLNYTFDGVSNITAITDKRNIPADSPQNASQAFEYDDLYRLIKAEGPGYGIIQYKYDKIGNMIWKKSPDAPNPQHIDNALINLGIMSCGGSAGSSNRSVKLPGDPPGPHAITSTESGLNYDYDDNGNMISNNDRDTYTWDFQDRLVKIQKNNETEANYVYDHSGQRAIKSVNNGTGEKLNLYINEAYEIRDGKAVKYVFAGKRRVARIEDIITAPDEHTEQILTFQQGWNLFSLKVEPDDPTLEVVLNAIDGKYTEVWMYDTYIGDYKGYVPSQWIYDLNELHAQKGYLINMTTPASLSVKGSKTTNDVYLNPGWNLIGCPLNNELPVIEALSFIKGKYRSVWSYDTETEQWMCFVPNAPPFLNDLKTMVPGRAYWVEMINDGLLSNVKKTQTFFYHPDHLGSSNLITNMYSEVVEYTEFYPYGRPRYEKHYDFASNYKYTGKELDIESNLMYYGARYYDPLVGRFISVDPLYTEIDSLEEENFNRLLHDPQRLNNYAYVVNNPIKLIDLLGLKAEEIYFVAKHPSWKDTYTSLKKLEKKGKLHVHRVGSLKEMAEKIAKKGRFQQYKKMYIIGHGISSDEIGTELQVGIILSGRAVRDLKNYYEYVKKIRLYLHPKAEIYTSGCRIGRRNMPGVGTSWARKSMKNIATAFQRRYYACPLDVSVSTRDPKRILTCPGFGWAYSDPEVLKYIVYRKYEFTLRLTRRGRVIPGPPIFTYEKLPIPKPFTKILEGPKINWKKYLK